MRNLVVYGVGELGTLFGAAALRTGLRVTPITRRSDVQETLDGVEAGTPLLVAVGERDLDAVLSTLPEGHRTDIILLQNELFPDAFRRHTLTPTVMVPWVLQKRGLPTQAAGTSPSFGKHSPLIAELFETLSLPACQLDSEDALHRALVDKYAFILTINALGVLVDRTLGRWLQEDAPLVWDICAEATRLGAALCGTTVDAEQARRATEDAMVLLAAVPARGRTARDRVERACREAARLGVPVPLLDSARDSAR